MPRMERNNTTSGEQEHLDTMYSTSYSSLGCTGLNEYGELSAELEERLLGQTAV